MGLIIRDLSDEDMLRIMAQENAEEWRNSAEATIESVRAAVFAYAGGIINLSEVPGARGPVRSVLLTGRETLAEFLRFKERAVKSALAWLAGVSYI